MEADLWSGELALYAWKRDFLYLHFITYFISLLKTKSSMWFDDEIFYLKGLSGQKSFHSYSECIIYMRGETLTQELHFHLTDHITSVGMGVGGLSPSGNPHQGSKRLFVQTPKPPRLTHVEISGGLIPKQSICVIPLDGSCRSVTNEALPVGNSLTHIIFL